MKLVAYELDGVRQIGALDGAAVVPYGDLDQFYQDPDGARPVGDPIDPGSLRQVPFVPKTARVFCVGINYMSHAGESKDAAGLDVPKHPMIFGRWQQSLVVDGDEVPVPPNEAGLDWEVELAVVIKSAAWAVDASEAHQHVLGYTAFNDLSARRKQLETPQFTLGKNADRSGPIGPWLVTADSVGDPKNLRVQTRVNGRQMQDGNTRDMIHDVDSLIAYITDTVTLLPGDVIAAGTPGGVGLGQSPPWFLTPGDIVEVEVENIGVLRNPIVARD
jgi:2-keto-4-pentenoate hydratase/2-oxohepta-3-ene-1,7-dioic acid hydratase in catechol pathway